MVRDLLNPRSIAVVGASTHPGKVGFIVLKNIIDGGFSGKIYPINPDASDIIGLKCYPTILSIKENIDLAVIIVPAKVVPQVLAECGQKRVKNAVIISSGFSEIGVKGITLQDAVEKISALYNIRILGPNCLGIIDPAGKLNISFGGALPLLGKTAIVSQSGATGTAIIDWAKENNFGFSHFVSLGNKIDYSEEDFLEFFAEDNQTKVVMAYLESISNGEKFIEVAKKITEKKPFIVLKSGRTEEGQKAAKSHTAALASDDVVVEAAFREAGVIRANTLEEFFELGLIFSQLKSNSSEVLVITNAGGPGVITADAISLKKDLCLFEFSQAKKKEIERVIPEIKAGNPIDLLGDATSDRF